MVKLRYSLRTLLLVMSLVAVVGLSTAFVCEMGVFAKRPVTQTLEDYLHLYPQAECIEVRGIEKGVEYEVLATFVTVTSPGDREARISHSVQGRRRDLRLSLAKDYEGILCAEFLDPRNDKPGYVVLGIPSNPPEP